MDNQPQPTQQPLIIVKRGALSSSASCQLRKAGYRVVFAEDPAAIKTFGAEEKFKDLSNDAKVKAFDYMLGNPHTENTPFYKNDLRRYYVHFLGIAGNF